MNKAELFKDLIDRPPPYTQKDVQDISLKIANIYDNLKNSKFENASEWHDKMLISTRMYMKLANMQLSPWQVI